MTHQCNTVTAVMLHHNPHLLLSFLLRHLTKFIPVLGLTPLCKLLTIPLLHFSTLLSKANAWFNLLLPVNFPETHKFFLLLKNQQHHHSNVSLSCKQNALLKYKSSFALKALTNKDNTLIINACLVDDIFKPVG